MRSSNSGSKRSARSKQALACRFYEDLCSCPITRRRPTRNSGKLRLCRIPSAILAALFSGFGSENCYEHQGRAEKTLGNAVLVAPTGSGKTESALLWASNRGQPKETRRCFTCCLSGQPQRDASPAGSFTGR